MGEGEWGGHVEQHRSRVRELVHVLDAWSVTISRERGGGGGSATACERRGRPASHGGPYSSTSPSGGRTLVERSIEWRRPRDEGGLAIDAAPAPPPSAAQRGRRGGGGRNGPSSSGSRRSAASRASGSIDAGSGARQRLRSNPRSLRRQPPSATAPSPSSGCGAARRDGRARAVLGERELAQEATRADVGARRRKSTSCTTRAASARPSATLPRSSARPPGHAPTGPGASTIAAARPLGPAPTTTASGTGCLEPTGASRRGRAPRPCRASNGSPRSARRCAISTTGAWKADAYDLGLDLAVVLAECAATARGVVPEGSSCLWPPIARPSRDRVRCAHQTCAWATVSPSRSVALSDPAGDMGPCGVISVNDTLLVGVEHHQRWRVHLAGRVMFRGDLARRDARSGP